MYLKSILATLSLFIAGSLAAVCENHQDKKIQLEGLSMTSNESFVSTSYSVDMNDDDTLALNGEFEIKQALDHICSVQVIWKEREGQETLTEQPLPLCDAAAKYKEFLDNLTLFGNFPADCPFDPRKVQIANYQPAASCYHEVLQQGLWDLVIVMDCQNDKGEKVEALRANVQVRIQNPTE